MQLNMDTTILRATAIDEQTCLLPSDIALIIPNHSAPVPDGYGAYLISAADCDECTRLNREFVLPEGCASGSFISITYKAGTPEVHLLGTSDLPDRTLFTTGRCNSNCIMCPYTEKYRLSAKDEQFDILSRYIDLMDAHSDYICITGGEPTLLKNDFLRLLYKVKSHMPNAMVHILTNGRTFYYNDFVKVYKKARPYRTLLGIPLHADNADLHDHITQSQGSFYETLKGIDNLYGAGEQIEIRIVTSALNCENLPMLAKFITSRYPQIHHVCFMGLEMMGNSMINRSSVWCSYDDIWPNIRTATETLIAGGIPVQLYNYPLCMVEEKYHSLYRKSITPSKIEYLDECAICCRMHECGGFFRTTKVMPDIKVIPYTR